jgi:hypothetical protein
VLVGVLCIVALADAGAIWVLAIVAIVQIAVIIVVDFLRIIDED